jgi:serine/threonine protein kinase
MFEGFKALFGGSGDKAQAKPAAASSRSGAPAKKPVAPAKPKIKKVNIARKYTTTGELGQGSMSRVYRAVELETGRVVCLKVQDREKTAAAMARSSQVNRPSEGEIGQRINHPHVVKTFDWGLTPKGEYFVVMEFIEGVSLNVLRETRPLTLELKLRLLAQAAQALEAVHAASFIHHDFGPKNLLVTPANVLKLIDFGLSVPNTAEFRRPGNRTGTLNYMAPELLRREPKDERIDIFSWGATAFEFLSNGRQPYEISSDMDQMASLRMRINSSPRSLAKVAPHLPPAVIEVVDRALARRPDDRWPTAARVSEALYDIIGPADEDEDARPDDRTFDW